MKTLIIVRHAKSSWNQPAISDFDRPLNNRGFRDVPIMAVRIHDSGVQQIYASPALRANTTAILIAEGAGLPESSIRYEKGIYAAGLAELFGVLMGMGDMYQTCMLIGHNPGVSNLALELTGRDIGAMPTCSVAKINLDIDTWTDIEGTHGELIRYEYPKMFID